MILIADSGSTKTDWAIVEQGKSTTFVTTKGMNPFFQTEEEIAREIEATLLPHINSASQLTHIYFYGAGCTPEKAPFMESALRVHLKPTQGIAIYSDIVAVAHAMCGHQPGIVCIMGTGSNSAYYDGAGIAKSVSPLGFILGDEGSGAVLGKLLVGDILKNQLSEELKEKFLSQYSLTQAEIIDRVYRKPLPNRFLASLSPFLLENISYHQIAKIVKSSFSAFFERNVMQYDYQNTPIHLIGSIAFYYQEILQEVASSLGLTVGSIEKSPMLGLVKYYQENELL